VETTEAQRAWSDAAATEDQMNEGRNMEWQEYDDSVHIPASHSPAFEMHARREQIECLPYRGNSWLTSSVLCVPPWWKRLAGRVGRWEPALRNWASPSPAMFAQFAESLWPARFAQPVVLPWPIRMTCWGALRAVECAHLGDVEIW